tara:strand:- start:681 stop:887 length:207 start_codon:yes stop_codon:yes gene_type:complete
MKNIIFILFSFIFLFSCSLYNESERLNAEDGQLAHSKFSNLNNNFSYDEYKLLIIKYGKNGEYPNINK